MKKPHGSAVQIKLVRVTWVRGTLTQALSHPSHSHLSHLDAGYKNRAVVNDVSFSPLYIFDFQAMAV
jgi:hypothetical protein